MKKDEYLHENPKTEPNPDIIVVSNVGDTTVTITENNPPQVKNFFTVNNTKYQTNNLNNYNNEYKSHIAGNNESTNISKFNTQHDINVTENQVEINVSKCHNIEIENDNLYSNCENDKKLNKQEVDTNINSKYQVFAKPKSIPNIVNKQSK